MIYILGLNKKADIEGSGPVTSKKRKSKDCAWDTISRAWNGSYYNIQSTQHEALMDEGIFSTNLHYKGGFQKTRSKASRYF